jgi:hypothetical protein
MKLVLWVFARVRDECGTSCALPFLRSNPNHLSKLFSTRANNSANGSWFPSSTDALMVPKEGLHQFSVVKKGQQKIVWLADRKPNPTGNGVW